MPAEGSHTCLLAAVMTRSDHPVAGRQVWEHNNLAQKNLTVVDLLPSAFLILPITVSNWQGLSQSEFALEVMRVGDSAPFEASLIYSHPEVFTTRIKPKPFGPFAGRPAPPREPQWLDCGGHLPRPRPESWGRMLTSATPDLIQERYPQSWELGFPASGGARLRVSLPPSHQTVVGLKIAVPPDAQPGQMIRLHFVQRSLALKRIVGGVAVRIHVVKPGELRVPPREKTF